MEFDVGEITTPFRMQPGLSRMAAGARHTRLLEAGSPLFQEKLTVLLNHADQALLQVTQFDARPALRALAPQLVVEWPAECSLNQDVLHLTGLGLNVSLETLEVGFSGTGVVSDCVMAIPQHLRPWAALSLFLQDDLAVLDGDSTELKILAVCVPSHWAPESKIGLPLAAVHAPVADNAVLVQASQSLAKLVTASGPDRWQRFVWTLQPGNRYDGHPQRAAPRRWPEQVDTLGEQLWFRAEHQTFIAAPLSRQAVFTVRVMLEPLASVITNQKQAMRLHGAISTMSDAVVAYRNFGAIKPLVLQWLERPLRGQAQL